ncbi:tail protein [Xanthomonas phage M29]|nr:tail protein [Xanthomonas phage M29]
MGLKPDYKVLANQKDITATIVDRLKSIRLTDETGDTADTLEITLADHIPDQPIQIPPTGAELELFLGYDGSVKPMGLFVCDEIELGGWPGEMVIRARAAPYEASKGGKTDLQTQKSRSWKKGTTIGAMVMKIAGEHGMQSSVSAGLASIKLPHTDQSSESDINLLSRLAKKYDAIAKPAGGKLLFLKRGDGKTSGGQDMPTFTVTPDITTQWRVTLASRDSAGTTVAYYRDVGAAKRKEIAVGEGEPVRRLRMAYKDQASALEAARAEQRKRARGESSITVSLPGDPDIMAESMMTMAGFRTGAAGEWLVSRVEHYVGPQGYRCSIEGEKPNKQSSVSGSTGKVKESDQAGEEVGG